MERPGVDLLEVFPNQFTDRPYEVRLAFPEFTSVCPKTGQPDFASIEIVYEPNKVCVETKSLKLYFFAYRQEGTFMETITNRICADLVTVLDPEWLQVHSKFASRGGVALEVVVEHHRDKV